jgi:hypothetical protein
MSKMSVYEDENIKNSNDVSQSGKSHSIRERGGLIPVTATILNEAEVTKEETVEYQGIPISDIMAIGYIFDYKELEAKVKITIFDYTGFIEINFFNKIDNQDSSGLNKLNYDGTRKAVQIFGTVKVFKNEKNIQGAKIIPVSSSFVLYHRADVIHSWLYLTGKLQELKENQLTNTTEEAKMIAMGNNNVNNQRNTPIKDNKEERDFKDAVAILDNYIKRGKNELKKNEIQNIFKKFGNRADKIIKQLIDENKLIDNDGVYEIL